MTHPKIEFTKNLGLFKFSDLNRNFDSIESKNRIKRIAESMIGDGLLVDPIIVSNRWIIVDGQHRIKSAEIAKKGIYFIVDHSIKNTPKAIFEAARLHNKNSKDWSKLDYLQGFAKQGNKNYKLLEDFRKEFPEFSLTEAMILLANSGTKFIKKEDFADGKFVIENMEIAKQWANNLLSLRPYFKDGYNRSSFVRTMMTIVEKKPEFNFERFLQKVKLNQDKLHICGDKKSYTLLIEEIYNHRSYAENKLSLRY